MQIEETKDLKLTDFLSHEGDIYITIPNMYLGNFLYNGWKIVRKADYSILKKSKYLSLMKAPERYKKKEKKNE